MHFNPKRNREKGSALLIVLMMVLMLTVLILEISFSAQTAYSIAKNQIEKAQMNEIAETGFAYALNIVQIKKNTAPTITTAAGGTSTISTSNPLTSGASIFSKAVDSSGAPDNTNQENNPPWMDPFPIVSIGGNLMKLKIGLEETKININRLVNSEDKVDIRIRSALIDIFKKFEGTEEDTDRIIDYIDLNTLGQYEDKALNGPIQSIGELLAIPDMKLKFSIEDPNQDTNEVNSVTTLGATTDAATEKKPILSDYITVKSTGRININYANEEIIKSVINGAQERAILETIMNDRKNTPYKTLGQLSLNKTFGSTFKKLESYLTVDETTFKVIITVRAKDAFKSRFYYGYIFNKSGKPTYILRTERIGGNDPELNIDEKDIGAASESAGNSDTPKDDDPENKTKSTPPKPSEGEQK
jgi:type II secretory pathway component PulK